MIRYLFRLNDVITATTGSAASLFSSYGGSTFHKAFNIPPRSLLNLKP